MSTPEGTKKKFAIEENDTFYDLFGGAEEIYGHGKSFALMDAYLGSAAKPEKLIKVMTACLVFHSKPTRYLLEGRKKKDDVQAGQIVDTGIAKYLPKHEQSVYDQEATDEMKAKRASWTQEFKSINMTMIRNIAFLSLEIDHMLSGGHLSSQTFQWLQKYGNKTPSQLVSLAHVFLAGSSKATIEIAESQFARWHADKVHWFPLARKYSTVIDKVMVEPSAFEKKAAKEGKKGKATKPTEVEEET